ncbi:MAG TPA: hypothetical protein VEQ37_05765, partial [Actinomycetota bacterium]|nr:hypothetical protein [Actinomycetota bacterium]
MRFIGLDVHKDFCEVAVVEGAACRSGPRVRSTPEDLEVFGQSLSLDDQVVLEATGGALAIARILEPYARPGGDSQPHGGASDRIGQGEDRSARCPDPGQTARG